MECVSDFGTVAFFNVQSLTTAIYDSWIIFDDINTAYQLSFFLIFFILIFLHLREDPGVDRDLASLLEDI